MIEQELEIIKKYISEGVENLLPNDLLKDFILGKSKMVRSKFGLLYSKIAYHTSSLQHGEGVNTQICSILAATELIHNASLLHDDVIDNSEIRRGKTTIGKEFSSNISILCGDYLVGQAINKLLLLNNSEVLELFNNCVQNMSKSEIKQYFLREKVPSLEEYLEICEGKTASLFIAMLKSLALTIGTSIEYAEKFGKTFGVYFQLKNDMDKLSANVDKKNSIYTLADILGVEKGNALLDNYRKEVIACLHELPYNESRDELEGLINNYDR